MGPWVHGSMGAWVDLWTYGPMDLRSVATRAAAAAGATAAARAASGGVLASALVAASAADDPFRVRQFVPETTLQASAEARELRRVQREVLLLRHAYRHRLERRQPRRAAQRTPARAVASEQARLVANADLPHLDARPEPGGQLLDEL